MNTPVSVASIQISPTTFRTRLVLGVLLLNLLVSALVGIAVRQSYHQYQERAEITTSNLAKLLENEIVTTLRDQDIVLLTVLDEYRRQRQAGAIDAATLNAYIEQVRARLPEIDALRITDAQGQLVYGSGVNPTSNTSLADRPHFIRLRDDPQAELVLSRPQISRVNQKWVIVLARRVNLPDEAFGGMIFAAVALEHFSRSFAALNVGRNGNITLRETGEMDVLVRNHDLPGNRSPVGQKGTSETLKKLLQSGQKTGTYQARSGLDGIERTFSYRHIGNFPLLVIVGLATEDYLAEWRRNTAMNGALVALFALMTVLAAVLIHRAWQRQHRALQDLALQEKKLRASEMRLLEAQRIAQIGSWELDLTTGKLIWSDEIFRIFEIDQTKFDASYEAFLNAIHPDDREAVNRAYNDSLTQRAPYEISHRLLMADGRVKWVNERCETDYDESGHPLHSTGTVQDITARKLAEERLRELNENLELRVAEAVDKNMTQERLLIQQSRLAAMGEMVHNIAHQWRQPLNALGLLQANIQDAFEYGELDKTLMRQFVEDGQRMIQKMSTTIDEFRDFFKPDREKTLFSLHDAIDHTLSIVSASFHNHAIEVTVDARADITLNGYPSEFSQVLLNILNNAKEAILEKHPTGGKITITLDQDGDNIQVTVKDNGGGIPESALARIFDPYFTTKPKGTGIGLYMSRMIMQHMDGTLAARNADEGMEFSMLFPRTH